MAIKLHHILGLNARNYEYLAPYNPAASRRIADSKLLTKSALKKQGISTPRLYKVFRREEEVGNFDFAKIDQSFVRNMLGSQVDQNIIRVIVQLAQGMNLCLVAEGVETAEHAQALKQMGCEIMQGFYYSRPLPLTEITRVIESRVPLPE